jgi:hypothetical protein
MWTSRRDCLVRTMVLLLCLTHVAQAQSQAPSSSTGVQDPAAALARAVESSLQADTRRSVEILRPLPADRFSGRDADYRDCVVERFGGSEPPPIGLSYVTDPLTHAVIEAFHVYWWNVTTRREPAPTAEAEPSRRLATAVGQGEAPPDRDRLETLLKEALGNRGIHTLMGITSPLRELMLWTQEDVRSYEVALPESIQKTKVVVLDGLIVAGWTEYVTCGRHGAGGWAVADALYAVRARYDDLEGENFKVTFLGHEAQHFADLNRFKGLEPWELEYRAKLVEVAQAKTTQSRVLQMFRANQSDDPTLTHSYANRRVITELTSRLGLSPEADLAAVEPEVLRTTAATALAADSRTRGR